MIRALLKLILVVIIVAAAAAFFLGYRIGDGGVELAAEPGSATASYWLAAAARGAGNLERAWDAARAGWIAAPLGKDQGATLRADLDRLMSPIGIDIGARTPEETAISICAEIIARRTGRVAPSLRDGSGPIHQPR